MDEIIGIVFNKSRKNELLNINDIEYIIDKLIMIYDVNNLLNNVKYSKTDTIYVGAYNNETKELNFNYKMIEQIIFYLKCNCNFNYHENYYLYYNINILQIIMHEFEHIYQEKLIITNSNKIYSILLKLFKNIPDNLKKDNYKICFEERTADIFSIKKINNIINLLNDFNKEIKIVINTDYQKKCVRGYKYYNNMYLNPTGEYINNCNEFISDSFDDVFDLINNNEKLIYGLDVPYEMILYLKSIIYNNENKYFKNRILVI